MKNHMEICGFDVKSSQIIQKSSKISQNQSKINQIHDFLNIFDENQQKIMHFRVLELTKQIDLAISCRMTVVPCRDVARGPHLCRNACFGKSVFYGVPRVLYIFHILFHILFHIFSYFGESPRLTCLRSHACYKACVLFMPIKPFARQKSDFRAFRTQFLKKIVVRLTLGVKKGLNSQIRSGGSIWA